MLTVMQAMCEIAADRASKLQKAWSITIFSCMAYHRQLHSCPPKDSMACGCGPLSRRS